MSWVVVSAVTAIAAVGVGAYSAFTAPGAPSYQAPPPPPNSTVLGVNGEIISRQVFDKDKNEWITYSAGARPEKPKEVENPGSKPITKTEYVDMGNAEVGPNMQPVEVGATADEIAAWEKKNNAYNQYGLDLEEWKKKDAEWSKNKAERDVEEGKLKDLRGKALDNLNTTSPERQAQIEQFGTAFADSMHRDIDPRFQKAGQATDEEMNARGLTGSRAYVDLKGELEKTRLASDTDIANQATMAKETLSAQDRQYWANLLNQIDSGQRSDLLAAAQVNKTNADTTVNNYAGTLGYYSAGNNNRLAQWEAERQKSAAYTQAGTGMANGLLYLYGGMKGNGTPKTTGNTGTSFSTTPTKTNYGTFSLFG